MLNSVTRVVFDGREVLLIGTAHVSSESVELVRATIEKEKPDYVAVELCEQRHHAIAEKRKWDETEISKVYRSGKSYLFLGQLLLTNFQRRVGDELGVKPGSEMVKALESAKENNIPVALVDRDITVTLKRAFNKMSFIEKAKVGFGLVSGMFGGEEVDKDMIEKLKETDMLTEMMEDLGRDIPSVKEVLVDERDHYIADKIAALDSKKAVAVVGAGHVAGIKRLLESKRLPKEDIVEEIASLETVPKSRSMMPYVNYLIPVSLVALLAYGFATNGSGFLMESALKWILITGSLSALGAIVALAHPASIIVAFLVAPITTIHPLLAAGWFAGLTEAKMRKPKVKDFDGLMNINSMRDFWKNGVTRILLVTAFTNLGASLGTFVGGLSIFAGVVPKIF